MYVPGNFFCRKTLEALYPISFMNFYSFRTHDDEMNKIMIFKIACMHD